MNDDTTPLVAKCSNCHADISVHCLAGLFPVTSIEEGPGGQPAIVVRQVPVVLSPLACPLCKEYVIRQKEGSKVLQPAKKILVADGFSK